MSLLTGAALEARRKGQGHRTGKGRGHREFVKWDGPVAQQAPEGVPCSFCAKVLAEVEKCGQSLCRRCASNLKGREYPVRGSMENGRLRVLDRILSLQAVHNMQMWEN